MKHLLPALVAAAAAATAAPAAAPQPRIAVYDLEGVLAESGSAQPGLLGGLRIEAGRPLTLAELTRSLARAAGDPAIAAVVVEADGADLDLAQVQEVRRRLLAVRDAGKPVWLYSERLDNGTALLGSAATRFTLMPEADVSLTGVFAEQLYFKGLLDKLGVQADVIHIGDFKSFGEVFYRTGPSEFAARQTEALVESAFGQLVAQVAEGRRLEPAKVRELIDRGALTADEAVAAGLADGLAHRTDFVAAARKEFGDKAQFDRAYELPDLEGPELDGMLDVLRLVFRKGQAERVKQDHVAVVALEGDISDESVAPVRRAILRCLADEHTKALVLRVSSPGGSALASEVLWEATDEWKAGGRPLAVSMGAVAASGGYYVSCGAPRIFAEPGTITGSIGVVGMKLVMGDALAKLGVTTHATGRGAHAGMATLTRPFTEPERELVRRSMLGVYQTFGRRVRDGRGDRLKAPFDELAGGRVFTGEQALALGLVDELGGLGEAVAWAAKEAGIDPAAAVLRPPPKGPLEGLFAPPEKDDVEIIRAGGQADALAGLRSLLAGTGVGAALPAPERRALDRLAGRLRALGRPQVLLLGPDVTLRW